MVEVSIFTIQFMFHDVAKLLAASPANQIKTKWLGDLICVQIGIN